MSYGPQTRNPWEDDTSDYDDPVYCRGCHGYLGERERLTPEAAESWNGWWWCPDCADELRRLAMGPDPFNEVRR